KGQKVQERERADPLPGASGGAQRQLSLECRPASRRHDPTGVCRTPEGSRGLAGEIWREYLRHARRTDSPSRLGCHHPEGDQGLLTPAEARGRNARLPEVRCRQVRLAPEGREQGGNPGEPDGLYAPSPYGCARPDRHRPRPPDPVIELYAWRPWITTSAYAAPRRAT